MSNEHDEQEKRGFKVEDRRRFSDTGEPRAAQRDASSDAPTGAGSAGPSSPPPLELNFSTLVLSFSTQALAHLGEIPHPLEPQSAVDLAAAKQLIDILGILKDKTKGNLDPAEGALLDKVLYDLRLKFVERVRGQREAQPR